MNEQGLCDDVSNPHTGIERTGGILKDDLHIAPDQLHLAGRKVKDRLSVESNATGGVRNQSKYRPGDGGLAASGFADQTERFAAIDMERDPVDGIQPFRRSPENSYAHGKSDRDLLHIQKRRRRPGIRTEIDILFRLPHARDHSNAKRVRRIRNGDANGRRL